MGRSCLLSKSGLELVTTEPISKRRFVARKNAPLVEKSCSSSLNGSDLEQMGYNRDGILPLEVADIWNESFDRVIQLSPMLMDLHGCTCTITSNKKTRSKASLLRG